jgi:hypothetical protein
MGDSDIVKQQEAVLHGNMMSIESNLHPRKFTHVSSLVARLWSDITDRTTRQRLPSLHVANRHDKLRTDQIKLVEAPRTEQCENIVMYNVRGEVQNAFLL